MGGSKTPVAVLEPPPSTPEAAASPPGMIAVPAVGPEAPVIEVLATTRAMRRLSSEPVPIELLRKVVEAATWAPSAGNFQLVHYLLVTDRSKIARLAPLWSWVIEDYRTMTESAGVDFGDPAVVTRMRATIDYQREHFAETPALVVVCEDPLESDRASRGRSATVLEMTRRVGLPKALRLARAFAHASDRAYGASIYPAVENLLIAARAYGLGATLTSWHLFAEREFKEVLGIPERIRTYAIIPVGWPLGKFGPVVRRPLDEVLHLDRW